MVPTYRVSNIAAYARWKQEDGDDIGWLYNSIFDSKSTDAMSRGTAFHSALQHIGTGDHNTVSADGYRFYFTCDAEVVLPKTREIRMSKDYGGIIVTGQCDGIAGRVIDDHKTMSGQFDAEHHLEGWQHKFYMDIFDADVFRWHCWELKEIKSLTARSFYISEHDFYDAPESGAFDVIAYHLMKQYRYPEMEEDCAQLAHEFRDFAAIRGWQGIRIAA